MPSLGRGLPLLSLLLASACSSAGGPHGGGGPDAKDPDAGSTADHPPIGPVLCEAAAVKACEPAAGSPDADGLIVAGTILAPEGPLCSGEVLVSRASGTILCVGETCRDRPEAAGAPVLCADVVSPGLVNAHDHAQYNHLPRFRHPGRLFANRGEWRAAPEYKPLKAAHSAMNDRSCEVGKQAELRHLFAGTTSIVGSGGAPCLGVLARNLDEGQALSGVPGPGANYVTFLKDEEPDELGADLAQGVPLFVHVAEGVDQASRDPEWNALAAAELVSDRTAVIHGTALGAAQLAELGAALGVLVWSPRSNLDLYGLTSPIPAARKLGLDVAIGSDWTPTGGLHLLEELRCADELVRGPFDGALDDRELVASVTTVPARVLGLDGRLGVLAEGALADVAAFRGDRARPYRALLEAGNDDVALVLVNGEPLYGDAELLLGARGADPTCDSLDVCGRSRTICVRRSGGPEGSDQGLAEIQSALETALADARAGSGCAGDDCYAYDLAPLWSCDPPAATDCVLGTDEIPGEGKAGDRDGDGVADDADGCPSVFDPPLAGVDLQDDADGDGEGDACDVCPLAADSADCPAPDPTDLDGDGAKNDVDNCRRLPNADQLDGDLDGVGDACDACPTDVEPTCATVRAVRDPKDPAHPLVGATVTLRGLSVTAVKASTENRHGIWVQDPTATELGGLLVWFAAGELPANVVVGSLVDVVGDYTEFHSLTELEHPTVTLLPGDPAPLAPIVVDPAMVATGGALAEALEGMLVRVEGVIVTVANPDAPEAYDEYTVTGGLRVDDLLIDDTNDGAPAPVEGTSYATVTGVLYYSFDNTKLEPRDATDVVVAP